MTSPNGETVARLKAELVPDGRGFRRATQKIVDATEDSIDGVDVPVTPHLNNVAVIIAEMKALARAAATDIPVGIDITGIDAATTALGRISQFDFGSLGIASNEIEIIGRNIVQVMSNAADETKRVSDNIVALARDGFQGIAIGADGAAVRVGNLGEHISSTGRELELFKANLPAIRADNIIEGSVVEGLIQAATAAHTFEVNVGGVAKRLSESDEGFQRSGKEIELWRDKAVVAFQRVSQELDLWHPEMRIKDAEINVKVNADLAPEVSNESKARLAAALALLTRAREVEIHPVLKEGGLAALSFVSVLSGFDALNKSIDQSREALFGLFTNLPQIMAMTPAVLGLAGAFLSGAANVTTLVASLAQALPILLALPGIAIGIGTMVVAFKDFGNVLPDVVSQFKELAPMISAAFWEQAKGPISDLAATVMPQLQAGLQGTASALGGFFAALSGAISNVIGGGVLEGWFASLSESIQIFTGFVEPLATIFKLFGDIGSNLLPLLAQYFGELAERFSVFMTSLVDGAGGLGPFVQQTMDAFKGIVETVISLGNIFGAVFTAASAAGGATFASLAAHLNTFAEFLKQPDIAAGMTALFGSAFAMFENFFNLAGPALQSFLTGIGGVLTTVLPQVGAALGQITQAFGAVFNNEAAMAGLTSFIQGLLTGVQLALPALQPLGDLIAALGPTLGLLATLIGTVFGALAPSFGGIITALQPIISLLGNGLVSVITALQPAITQLGTAIATALADPAFAAALQAVVNGILALVPALTPLISLAAGLVAALMPIVAAILEPLAGLITAIVPMLTPLVDVILQVVGAVTPLIPILLDLIMSVLGPLLPIVAQLAGALLPILAVAFQVLAPIIEVLVMVIQKILDVIMPILVPALQFLADILTGVLGIAFEAIGKIVDVTFEFIMGIWDAFSLLFEGDFTGFWEKIKSVFTEFGNKCREIFGTMLHALAALAEDLMAKVGQKIGDGILAVIEWFKGLPGRVQESMDNLRTMLVQAGKDIIESLIRGITERFQAVKDKLAELTNLLPDWKGPESRDKKLLTPAGQSIMDGFLEGLESRYDAVRKSLTGFSGEVGDTKFKAPTVMSGALSALAAAIGTDGASGGSRTFNYFAAPGSSLGSEEDLFAALGRGRAFGGF